MPLRRLDRPQLLAPFTRADLPALGITRHQLDHRLRTGEVVQPVTGVYAGRARLGDDGDRARAAGLALPPTAVLARRTAGWVYGHDTRSPDERGAPLPLECLVPANGSVATRRGMAVFESTVPDADVEQVDGILVTSHLRTAMDLARYLRPHMGLAVLDAMLGRGLIDREELCQRLAALPGERWTARARYLALHCDGRAESYPESWPRLRVLDAGFPPPVPQVWIRDDDGTPLYRLDLAWPELRIGVEYDGQEFHSSPEQRAHDARRRADAYRRFGWRVVGVGRAEVLGRSLALENGIGELLGMTPRIQRRAW